jgi:dienelactone hydrolase
VLAAGAALSAPLLSLAACAAPATSPQTRTQTHPPSHPPSRSPADASHSPGVTAGIGKLGRFRTARASLTVTEPARTGAGQPRRLLIQIWHPLTGSQASSASPATRRLPLIVFGPGFMQCGGPYGDLLRAWASAGYVVAAVNFPYSDCRTGAAATESDLVNQPGDVSYAITALLHRRVTRPLGGRLNPREIAVAGQSDGGDTVAAVAANACCTDRRVRAVAVLSGAEWPAMPGAFFARPPVPMLFTQGSSDTVNLPGCSVAMYRADPAERFYLDLIGADHTGPYWGTNTYERVVARVTLAFFNRYVLGHRSASRAMSRAGNVRHTARLFSHGGGHLSRGPCLT